MPATNVAVIHAFIRDEPEWGPPPYSHTWHIGGQINDSHRTLHLRDHDDAVASKPIGKPKVFVNGWAPQRRADELIRAARAEGLEVTPVMGPDALPKESE